MSIKYKDQTISGPPGKGAMLHSVPIILTASGWINGSQSVAVSGVSADETTQLIQPVPAIANQKSYHGAGILCTNQGADSLTFTADTTPTEDLTVYVVVQEVEV